MFNWTMTLRYLIIFLKGPAFLTGILHTFSHAPDNTPAVLPRSSAGSCKRGRNKGVNQRKAKEGEGHLDSGAVDGGYHGHECRTMKRDENARKRRREERIHCDSDTIPSPTDEDQRLFRYMHIVLTRHPSW